MARGMHVHRSIRRERLAAHKIKTRRRNAPAKRAAGERRDARMLKVIAGAASLDFNPAVKSWVARQLGKPFSKVTQADLKSLA